MTTKPVRQYTTCLRMHTTINATSEADLREQVARVAGDIENFAGVQLDETVEYTYTVPFVDPDTGAETGAMGDGVVQVIR